MIVCPREQIASFSVRLSYRECSHSLLSVPEKRQSSLQLNIKRTIAKNSYEISKYKQKMSQKAMVIHIIDA